MDLQSIMQSDKKKKIVIIGVIILLIILGLIFIFTRKNTSQENQYGQNGQTQLLTDIAQLEPRDVSSQNTNILLNKAPIITLTATPAVVSPGQGAIIAWSSDNAVSCTDGDGNKVKTSGSISITPREAYTLDIICTNPKGTTLESAMVAVTTSPIITLSAYPETVKSGEQSFISWSTVNTTRCFDDAGKTLRLSDGFSVVIKKPYTFKINCTGPNGTGKNSVTVLVSYSKTSGTSIGTGGNGTTGATSTNTSSYTPPVTTTTYTPPPASVTTKPAPPKTPQGPGPAITLYTDKPTLKPGETATVTWSSTNATSCTGTTPTGVAVVRPDGGVVVVLAGTIVPDVPTSGSLQIRVLTGKPKATVIISCTGPSGNTQKEITVYADATAKQVLGPPVIHLSANPDQVSAGGQSTISWDTIYATECTGGVGTNTWAEWYEPINNTWTNIHALLVGLGTNGNAHVKPGTPDPDPMFPPKCDNEGGCWLNPTPQSTTFSISCTGPMGRDTKSVTVTIIPAGCSKGLFGLSCGFY